MEAHTVRTYLLGSTLLLSLVVTLSPACSVTGDLGGGATDPRCSAENCHAMAASCRVDFAGAPGGSSAASNCRNVGPVPDGFDQDQFCPAICNAVLGGAVAACLAAKAAVCDSGDAGLAIAQCAGAGGAAAAPPWSDQCLATLDSCNTRCTGGAQCFKCRADADAGCDGVCPDGGYVGCMSCSFECGLAYGACLQHAP
jgi:hypothetical protein